MPISLPPRVTQTTDDFKFNPSKKSIREHPLLITNLFDFDRSGVESRSTLPPEFHLPPSFPRAR